MSTDTSSALDQPSTTGTPPKPPRDKVMRIATMTKQLLDEGHTLTLDTASLDRLRAIDNQILGELLTDLTPDLRQELHRLALPLTHYTELSDAELRLAHAQLVGWLQGLLDTIQTATGTSPSSDIPTAPDDVAPNHDSPAIRSARQTLIGAITRRITQQRLTAAQAAAVLHLTGPRVTKLLQANIDEFTVDELISLLPALELTIQVVPSRRSPTRPVRPRRRRTCSHPADEPS